MARTVNEILTDMLAAKAAEAGLNGLTSTSITSVWRLVFYIVAVCAWSLETLFDVLKAEILDIIAKMKPHSPRWYVEKVKEFQYGYNLVPETDYYDNTGLTESQITASKIVSYAAFVEYPFVRLKLAKTNGNALEALTNTERQAVVAYMLRVKDAGVKLKDSTITSGAPDKLKIALRIKYNPLVLDSSGARIDGTSATPVIDALRAFLTNFNQSSFNGTFSVQKMVDALQAVEGVEDLKVDSLQTQYGALPFTAVDIDFVPDAGYLIIDNGDFSATYIAA